jgi:5'-3' exonuclease
MTERTILVDGDTVAFVAASACQHVLETDGGNLEHFARRAEGETIVDNILFTLQRDLKADKVMVFLSCPSEDNWRLKVDPNYKANRAKSVRPLLLSPLKEYLRNRYDAQHFAFLEADDALGIHATSEELVPGEKVVVGRDKDFKTIPGLHFQFKDLDDKGKPIIREVTPMAAKINHYVQALAGDAVDGYPGCPGLGMKRAREIVETPERLIPKEGMITRGKNKGQKTTKWVSAGPSTIWEAIVSQYEKAGLGEAEALMTARLAKILLAEDYNVETHEVRLWVPGEE